MMAWISSLMAPFEMLKNEFSTWRSEKNYSIMLTGQRIYMEQLLNDNFDIVQRRIYIENSTPSSPEFAYNIVESAVGYYQYNNYNEEVTYNDNDFCAFEGLVYQYDGNVVDNSFHLIDFENAVKDTYDLELVYFNSRSFFVQDAVIYNELYHAGTPNWALGDRCLSMKGTDLATIETAESIYNVKKLSFYYTKHSSSDEIHWVVEVFYENYGSEYPSDPGDPFFWLGEDIKLPTRNYEVLRTFRPSSDTGYLEVDVEHPRRAHFRIRPLTESTDKTYRLNIDNIRFDFDYAPPGFNDYFTESDSIYFMRNMLEYLSQVDFNVYTPALSAFEILALKRLLKQYSIVTKKFEVIEI